MERIIVEELINERIDSYLSKNTDYSRSKIVKMLKDKAILVNDKEVKNSYILKQGDSIYIGEYKEEAMSIEPEDIPLDIVYEDEDVIVVNKPNKMVVHPAIGNNHGTLVNALLYHSKKLSDINGEFRPGIVHRIDADTTRLLMVAKKNKAHEILADELSKKETTRKYIALVWGVIKDGKEAVTHFSVLERYKNFTLIHCKLETGRTHQIRVHMNYIDHPVVNDPVYGRRKLIDDTGQCLHAKTIGFIHPTTKEYMEFTSELPECFTNILNIFEEEKKQ